MSVEVMQIESRENLLDQNIRWYSCKGFLMRVRGSRLFSMVFYENENISVDEVDLIVNTITLVNALILTIPFEIMTSLTVSNMDEFEVALSQCLIEGEPGDLYFKTQSELDYFLKLQYGWMTKSTLISIYVPLISLIIAVLYYFFRPSKLSDSKVEENKEFLKWWRRGRFLVLKLFLGMVIDSITLLKRYLILIYNAGYLHVFLSMSCEYVLYKLCVIFL